jgi:predicted DNA-binding transcriptional regulator YafY
MSEKEIKRIQIMDQLEKKQVTQKVSAEQLDISVRQIKRLWRAYQEQGAAGLVNKSRGKPSHNQLSVNSRAREEVELHFVPDEAKSLVEIRFWAHRKLVLQ